MLAFLKSRQALILTVLLLSQAALFYGLSRPEMAPKPPSLIEFPETVAGWRMIEQGVIEKEILDVLRADDTLTRIYRDTSSGHMGSLFIAYFKSQRTGQAPHSPKNCLPGSGWVPTNSEILSVDVPGHAPIQVNRYVVARGDNKSVVIYWYQTPTRAIASEYSAKIYLVLDSIRYNRSDTALVRVVMPVAGGDEDAATAKALDLVRSSYPQVLHFFPALN